MKYAVAALALAGAVVAMPTEPEYPHPEPHPEPTQWETWTTTPEPPKATWEPAPVPEHKCSEIKTEYYTKYDDENNKWGNYHVETKYVTEYPETCWEGWTKTKEDPKPTWAPAPVPEHKCSEIKTEYCTVYDDENNKWGNYHVETKYTTLYPETCWEEWTTKEADKTTWAVWTTKEVPAATTWATWEPAKETPAASTEWTPVKVSPTVPAPVAKWTGAANKANIAGGLAGIAGLAALLL